MASDRRSGIALGIVLLALTVAQGQEHQGKTLPQWAQELEAKDLAQREAAADAIQELGYRHPDLRARAVKILRGRLSDEALLPRTLNCLSNLLEPQEALALLISYVGTKSSADVRSSALGCLAMEGEDASPALPTLLLLVDDPDVASEVLDTIASMDLRARGALPAAVRILGDERRSGQWSSACSVIQAAGFADAKTLAALEAALRSESPWVRSAAYQALGGAEGPQQAPALALLRAGLKSEDKVARAAGIAGLTNLGPAASPTLSEILAFADSPILRVTALKGLGARALKALPELIELLGDPDQLVRSVALDTLEGLGIEAKPAIPALLKRLAVSEDRFGSLAALKAALAGSGEVPAPVAELLRSDDPKAAGWAASVVGKIGGPRAHGLLAACSKHPSPRARAAAVDALGDLGAKEGLALANSALKSSDDYERLCAAITLGRLSEASPEALAALRECLRADSNLRNRAEAARALGALEARDPTSLKALREAALGPQALVAIVAAGANYRLGQAREIGLGRLLVGLRSRSARVRYEACRALGSAPKASQQDAATTLAGLLARWPRSRDRSRALEALEELGPAAKGALPALERLARDPASRFEREEVARVLSKVRGG